MKKYIKQLEKRCEDPPELAEMVPTETTAMATTPTATTALVLAPPQASSAPAQPNLGTADLDWIILPINMPQLEISEEKKFNINTVSFPHGIHDYFRTGEKLAPHVEQRRPIKISFKLFNALCPQARCSEANLSRNPYVPEDIYFKLMLVYDDDGTTVTLQNLSSTASHLT